MSIDYNAYLGLPSVRHTTKYYVDANIERLYDFCILKTRYKGRIGDPLEKPTREMLTACGTESAMFSCLHDVIFNDNSLKKLLIQKGVLEA